MFWNLFDVMSQPTTLDCITEDVTVSKHVFALSIKLLSPDDGGSLEYCTGNYITVSSGYDLPYQSYGIWKYTIQCPKDCMNTHLWIELMPAKHTISFILLDCKQLVG